MKKKILVIGARYSMNLGDDIIFDTVAEVCRSARGNEIIGMSISGLTGYQDKKISPANVSTIKKLIRSTRLFQEYANVKRCRRMQSALEKLNPEEIDTIVLAGGQLFMDTFVPMLQIIVQFAELHGVKVIFNACGFGRLSRGSKRILAQLLCSDAVKAISIRDNVSQLNEIYKGKLPVPLVIDPAISCCNVYEASERSRERRIGIGIISMEALKKHRIALDKEQYVELIRQIVSACEAAEISCELFCNGDVFDYNFAAELSELFSGRVSLAKQPRRPEELISIITSYSGIVSFRLHSHIVAASFDIPSIGLIWDKKVREFFENIGREQWLFATGKRMDYAELKEMMQRLFAEESAGVQMKFPNSCEQLRESLLAE